MQMSTIRMREAATTKIPVLPRRVVCTNIWKFMANRHRSRGNTCPAEYHAGMSDLKQIPDVSAQHTLSHSGTIFFCHGTNLFFASHPFGQNLPSICMSNPNEMVDFLICLTFSTKNCLSNTWQYGKSVTNLSDIKKKTCSFFNFKLGSTWLETGSWP